MQLYLPIAGMTLDLWLLLGLGLSVGILSGIFGVGGGFILTPLLIVLGVPPLVAVGTGASIVVAASVSGALAQWQRGNVDVAMGLVLVASGIAGAGLGSQLQAWLKSLGQLELFTSITYAGILTAIGSVMLTEGLWAWRQAMYPAVAVGRQRRPDRGMLQKLPLRMRFRRSKMYISVVPPVVIGMFVGLATAIMGAGGGFLLIPLLLYILKLNTRVALGTSAFQVMCVTAFTTVLQAHVNQNVDIMLGLPLMLGSVVGAQYGVRMGGALKPEQLRILLALLVLSVGTRMAYDLTAKPDELYNLQDATLHR
ncbi:MAG: sulfite exporter TauE/SafE family protein [Hyphomicrobiaceae bacterium]|nr:sulfite exporter TauE/SafE family protein [Hyphomicrobiaceae bacterium]